MKIKTFQFLLSNHLGNDIYHDSDVDLAKMVKVNKNNPYSTEKDIDKKINRWIAKNNVVPVDIKVTTYAILHHNNGGKDAVCAIYTIMYEPLEKEKDEAETERDHGNTDDSADYGN